MIVSSRRNICCDNSSSGREGKKVTCINSSNSSSVRWKEIRDSWMGDQMNIPIKLQSQRQISSRMQSSLITTCSCSKMEEGFMTILKKIPTPMLIIIGLKRLEILTKQELWVELREMDRILSLHNAIKIQILTHPLKIQVILVWMKMIQY